MNLNSSQNVIVSINVQVKLNLDPINVSINVQFTILNKKKTNFIELKSMFLKHQKEVKLVKIFSTGVKQRFLCACNYTCITFG